MAVYDNRHSRRVALLKWVLPLLALVILSTMFLAADRRGTGDVVPFSSVELDQIVSDQRVSGPNFTTVTDDGSALIVAARDLTPGGDGDAGRASDLIAVLESPSGARLDLSSDSGTLETRVGRARLEGGVALRSTNGYQLRGAAFDIDRDSASIVSDGAVQGSGPPGELQAGQLHVTRTGADHVLNFTDGVKLVYDPASDRDE